MAKIQKHAAFLDQLHSMVTKEAAAGTATGKPGADTHPVSVSEKTEHVNKNEEGKPEHNPQEFKQHPASDPSDPTKTHHKKADEAPEAEKTAEKSPAAAHMPGTALEAKAPAKEAPHAVTQKEAAEVAPVAEVKVASTNDKLAALGQQLLDTVNELNKEATAGKASGKPGVDTHPVSVSEKTEHVNKNEQGKPEKNPQEFEQHPAKDPSDPSKTHHKKADEAELDKEASFELGRQFARTFLTTKTAGVVDLYKEAGRRDFEALIAEASASLDQEAKPVAKVQEKQAAAVDNSAAEAALTKQAEADGAKAFQDLYKQAQEQEQANLYKQAVEQQINQLLAEKQAAVNYAQQMAAKLAAHEAEMQKKAEEEKLDNKLAQWARFVGEDVVNRLKSESIK